MICFLGISNFFSTYLSILTGMGRECSGAASLGIRQHLLQDASVWSPSSPLRSLLVGVGVGDWEGRGGGQECGGGVGEWKGCCLHQSSHP